MNAHDWREKTHRNRNTYTPKDIEIEAKRKVIKNREYCSNQCPNSKFQYELTQNPAKSIQTKKKLQNPSNVAEY